MVLFTIVIFLIVLGLLVFVHEAGHFIVGKRSGMKIDEFGFGFPPRLFGFQKQNGKWKTVWGNKTLVDPETTVYSINWIPLGGFVKIVGENNEDGEDPRSFINKPFLPRLMTLLAGVIMNVILAWVLISIGYLHGLPVAVDNPPTQLGDHARATDPRIAIVDVAANSPAAQAGLKPNDVVKSIDGQKFEHFDELQKYVDGHKGQIMVFDVDRFNADKIISVQSNANPPAGSGPTGIALADVETVSYPAYAALQEGARATLYELYAIVHGLYELFSTGVGLSSIGGPVKIAQLTGQVARVGIVSLLQFTAFLSLNLAILNVLPIPALDGGRVLFLIIEKIRGKRNNAKIEQWANTIGFMALLLLMLVVTARDVSGLSAIQHLIK